jgi:CxxC motif-containing protein (DUF1111 family)
VVGQTGSSVPFVFALPSPGSAPRTYGGLGQRIFFLPDGRTTNLLEAITEHASSGSEANGVISNFRQLSPEQKQDLLKFLGSL